MDSVAMSVARVCLAASYDGTLTFPQVVGKLAEAGFESYAIDFRHATARYYRPDGDSMELKAHRYDVSIPEVFDAAAVQAAIGEAQRLAPGYTYDGFCRKVMAAGCTGYVVSFPGRRAVYSGRTAQTHVEEFPQQA